MTSLSLEGVDPKVWRAITEQEAATMEQPEEMLVYGVISSDDPVLLFVRREQ